MDGSEIVARVVDARASTMIFKALYGETLVWRLGAHRGYRSGSSRNNGVPLREKRCRRVRISSSAALVAPKTASPPLPSCKNHRLHGRQRVRSPLNRAATARSSLWRSRARTFRFTIVPALVLPPALRMCGRAYSPRQLWMWAERTHLGEVRRASSTVLSIVGDRIPTRSAQVRGGMDPYYSTARLCTTHHHPLDTRRVSRSASRGVERTIPEEHVFGIFPGC